MKLSWEEEKKKLPGMQKRERIKDILASHGIRMMIWGCGCCESPVVSFEYNGEMILDNDEICKIDMICEKGKQDEELY